MTNIFDTLWAFGLNVIELVQVCYEWFMTEDIPIFEMSLWELLTNPWTIVTFIAVWLFIQFTPFT